MPRPPREDRNTVGSKHLAFRLSQYEYELLMMCVQVKNQQMAGIGLPPLMNPTAFVKSLILQEAERLLAPEEVVRRRNAPPQYVLPTSEPAIERAEERARSLARWAVAGGKIAFTKKKKK